MKETESEHIIPYALYISVCMFERHKRWNQFFKDEIQKRRTNTQIKSKLTSSSVMLDPSLSSFTLLCAYIMSVRCVLHTI